MSNFVRRVADGVYPGRCVAWTDELDVCGKPATHVVKVKPKPRVRLDFAIADQLCADRGRCDEHAQPFLDVGGQIIGKRLVFSILRVAL